MEPLLTLYAPLSGKTIDLSEVPDEVFAAKMAGDGFAIRPVSNVLKAPCAAKVLNIHRCRHAITLRTLDSCDILVHIGLDTVALNGQGFTAKVKGGDDVELGDNLIEFDLDYLKQNAKSTLTEVVLINGEKVMIQPVIGEKVTAEKDIAAYLYPADKIQLKQPLKESGVSKESMRSWDIVVKDESGLHARPAAKIADTAKKFSAEVRIVKGTEKVNAKSMVSIMGLNIKGGDKVHFEAKGKDAKEALYELMPLLQDLKENSESKNIKKVEVKAAKNERAKKEKNDSNFGFLRGTGASGGVATGLSYVYKEDVNGFAEETDNPKKEVEDLLAALAVAKEQLKTLQENSETTTGADVFLAHKELLEDDVLLDDAFDIINSGKTAAFAWQEVTKKQAEKLLKLDNPVLAGRAADLKDVGNRVLAVLSGTPQKTDLPEDAILIAEDITPSMVAQWGEKKPCGFASVYGSATSHAGLLAASLGIPAVVGLPESILTLPNNTRVILDGTKGIFTVPLNDEQVQRALRQRDEEAEQKAAAMAKSSLEAVTVDGHKTEVGGNIAGLDDALQAMQNGADGCGLLRTEFMFLNRQHAPDEEEQADMYIQIAKAIGKGKKMIVRTLDIGGDKNVPFINVGKEENPFLGVRGIRLCFKYSDLFCTQIRAVLRAAEFTDLHIMFPMISSVAEFETAKKMVLEQKYALKITSEVKIGLMMEIPSAALLADEFAELADFFSVGTNDLTQYVLAADRTNPELNKLADALHPAVLKLIKMSVDAAHKHGKFVGVCGGLAGDKIAVPVLLGLGVDELSVPVGLIPEIKETVRQTDFANAVKIADEVLTFADSRQVREFLDG